jgi:hypothetical protein
MVEAVKQFGPAAGEYVLGYQATGDPVEEGDLVPVITLSLRPAHVENNDGVVG